jgi:uncharacterized protein involved in outer membrane biogenesis
MRSRLRLLLLLICLLLVLALGVFSLSQSRLVRARVLAWAEATLSDMLGREVRVEAVQLQPWTGSLELTGLRVAGAKRLADGVLFSAETIRTRWSWSALVRRQLVLRQIALIRPRLMLSAQAAPGLTAQDILPVLFQSRVLEGGGWALRVRRASVNDGRLTWTDSRGMQGVLDGLEGDLRWTWASGGGVSTTASLRAARLTTARGETTRQLDRISLQVAGTADALSVTAAEFSVAGASVTARGDIGDLARAPRLDLGLGVQAPLRSVLLALGADRPVEGTAAVEGRLQGPWEQAVFRGEGSLRFAGDQGKGGPLRFSVRWEGGRLEAETLGSPAEVSGSFRGALALEPATGLFRVRAELKDTDLAALPGLPAAAVAELGVRLPPEMRGRMTGEVDLTGRAGDVSALRGQVSLRARDLALQGETPSGRLEVRLTATASRVDVETFNLRLPGGDVTGRGGLTVATGKLDLPFRAELRDVTAFARGFGLRFLEGRATLRGRVTGTRQAPSLRGRVTWREARIAGRAVDLIEGDVEVARRVLRTSRLTVRSGQSTAVLQGSVEASGAAPLRRLNPKRDLVLDLQIQVNPGRTADLVGLLPDDVEVQGAFRAAGRVKGTLQALTGEVEVAFENVRTWDETWQHGEGVFRLRPGAVEIARIVLRRGAERLAGEIGIGVGGALRGRLTSTTMDVAKVGWLQGSELAGRATFRLDFQGTLHETVTLGQATVGALSYRGIPVGPGAATFKVEHKAVDVDLAVRDGTHRLRVSVGPPGDRSVRGELILSDADLNLVARAGEMETLRSYHARGSGRIRFGGPAGAPAFGKGEADFTSLRLQLAGETWESQGSVRASWSGPTMNVRQLRLRAGGRAFEVRGTVGEGEQTDLTVTGQVPLILLTDYLPLVRSTGGLVIANLRLRGDRSARTFHGTLEIRQGQLTLSGLPADFREVQAALELQGNRTQIREWRARLAEGTFRAAGEIGLHGGRWDLRLTFQEEDGRAEQFPLGGSRGKGEVTGLLSLGGLLTSGGEESADFWRNLGGDLELVLRDGRIGRYTVTAKILALLNVAQLVDLKGPELTAEGMPYQRLTADIKIARGIARTDNLVLDSRAMKVTAVGAVNLAEDTVDLTVAVKPFQNVDRILTTIPLAGWLLGGKEKSIFVAYYHVTGSLREPQVTAVPLKSVGRNAFGIFRNLLEIPEALTGPYEELSPQPVKPEEGQRR